MIDCFKVEAYAWIKIGKHANIVTAYSFDIIEDRPFIFIELIVPDERGRNTLKDYIKTDISELKIDETISQQLFPEYKLSKEITLIKPLFLEVQILEWAIEFCYGIEHAKSNGISPHRDIKPDNIMITKDKTLKITDFGLAKIWDEVEDISKLKNLSEEVGSFLHPDSIKKFSGTLEYMAPEQFEGKSNEMSDLYSFGIILYQMANKGIHPFHIDKNNEDIYSEYYSAHKYTEITKINSDIFPIIQKCLAKSPDDRYSEFKALRKDLEILYNEKTGHDPPKPPKDTELEAGEHVNKAYALSKLGFKQESISELQKAILHDPKLVPAHMNLSIEYYQSKQYEKAIEELNEVINLNPNHSHAHYNIANILSRIGESNEVIYHYEKAIRFNPECKEAHVNMGFILYSTGQIDEAISEYKKALIIDPNFFKAIMNLGLAFDHKGKYDEAIELYEQAYKINPDNPGLYNNWGITLSNKGDNNEALLKYINALTLKSDYSEAHNNFGISFNAIGKSDVAIHEFNEAIECNPNNPVPYIGLGIILAESEEYNEAIIKFEKALKIDSKYNSDVQSHLIGVIMEYSSKLLGIKRTT